MIILIYIYSILFEYTSQKHKIVINYDTVKITLISMINRETFEDVPYSVLQKMSNIVRSPPTYQSYDKV